MWLADFSMRLADCRSRVGSCMRFAPPICSADYRLRGLPSRTRIKQITDCDEAPGMSNRLDKGKPDKE